MISSPTRIDNSNSNCHESIDVSVRGAQLSEWITCHSPTNWLKTVCFALNILQLWWQMNSPRVDYLKMWFAQSNRCSLFLSNQFVLNDFFGIGANDLFHFSLRLAFFRKLMIPMDLILKCGRQQIKMSFRVEHDANQKCWNRNSLPTKFKNIKLKRLRFCKSPFRWYPCC